MWKKVAAALAALCIIFAVGLVVGLAGRFWLPFGGGPRTYNTATLLTQVQNLRELVTVKYVLEKVVVYEDPKWYRDNRVLLVAHGVAKAGIDLAMIKPDDIHISEKKIRVTLPPARITDVYLDDRRTQGLERSTGVMRSFDKDLEQNARVIAVEDLRRAASENGIVNDANERAKVELTALFYQLGFSDVEFRQK